MRWDVPLLRRSCAQLRHGCAGTRLQRWSHLRGEVDAADAIVLARRADDGDGVEDALAGT